MNTILSKNKNLRMDTLRYPKTVYTTGVGGRAKQGPYRQHDVALNLQITCLEMNIFAHFLHGSTDLFLGLNIFHSE